jgi:glycerol-3-phosphate dehydrogenase
MWVKGWRQQAWQQLDQEWDILVIGGGITGAGVFRRAVQEGYKTLLVEAGDFASGTSSNSSKLIHGGIRYLRNKQYKVTRESLREREWLLKEAPHLVTPLGFLMPCTHDRKMISMYSFGVFLYDLLVPKWKHYRLSRNQMLQEFSFFDTENLACGFLYFDAGMDDSCMVLRLLREAVAKGGIALNYAKATSLLKDSNGFVRGAVISDQSSIGLGEVEVKARVVINATGPWSDEVREGINAPARLRKIRGSHLVFSADRLSLPHAISILHPHDRRAMFAIPWEGVSIIGTTDFDHPWPLSEGEPYTTQKEIEYILQAANATFPALELGRSDIIATYSGVRPVINTGKTDPSKESRTHAVWEENGMITITGGKYTTFRIMAEDALRMALPYLAHPSDLSRSKPYFSPLPAIKPPQGITLGTWNKILGRYGGETAQLLEYVGVEGNQPIHNLPILWSELRWAARTGAIEHLDDLLLRRVRLGLQLPDGARADMARIRALAQPELGWSDARWDAELQRYYDIYAKSYSPAPLGF